MSGKLLEMKGVTKQFPGVYALKGVDFELESGEVHALLGENGAGKSTLMKILNGIYDINEGKIFINGNEVQINGVKDAQKFGISIIHQEISLVPYLSIAENIYLGREPLTKARFVDIKLMYENAQKFLDDFDLGLSAKTVVNQLTVAQQQMIEIIKAVSFHSKIIVMDEPTSSLTDKEVEFLFKTIRNLKEQGVGIVYISHRMNELFEITDRITVMRDGTYVGTVVTKETTNDKLIAMMVGRELTNYYVRDFSATGETILKVSNLTRKGVIENASFELRKGEILGFSGLVGAGRSELMKCIFGLDLFEQGEIMVNGTKVNIKNPNDAIKNRIAYVTENRKEEGLFLTQSVKYNLTIKILQDFIKFLRVNFKYENNETNHYINELSIKTPSPEQEVGNLSGGNQQKVLISRWLATKPQVLILDEPTRGVDVGAKAEIYAIMNRLAKEGVSIIMISSELPEVINMSDRVAVMYKGKIQKILNKEDSDQETIMHYATGGELKMSQVSYNLNKKDNIVMNLGVSIKNFLRENLGIIIGLIVLCIVISLVNPNFLSSNNLLNVLRQTSTNLYLALAMTMIIIIGGIDLSVGSIMAVVGVVTTSLIALFSFPVAAAVAVGVLVGMLIGALNGYIAATTIIPPFIITLATMNIARGAAYVISDGKPIRVMSDSFNSIGSGYIGGILPMPVFYLIILLIICYFIMNKTKLGRYMYAVGGNAEAAKFSGINIKKVKFFAYTFGGFMSAVAGIVLASRMFSGQPTSGTGAELDAIAAVVLGGTSMTGGYGRIGGTVIGALIIGVLSNGLNLMGVSSFWQYIVKGIVILVAVYADVIKKRKS